MSEDPFEKRWGDFRDLVTHMFHESSHPRTDNEVVWYPATDVYQTEDGFVVRMELSGVRRDDLQIVMQGNLLEVRGLRRSGLPPGRKRFHNLEIAMGPFLRQLKVPTEFAQGEAKASYNDGILEIKLGGKMKRKGGVVRIELVGGGE